VLVVVLFLVPFASFVYGHLQSWCAALIAF